MEFKLNIDKGGNQMSKATKKPALKKGAAKKSAAKTAKKKAA